MINGLSQMYRRMVEEGSITEGHYELLIKNLEDFTGGRV